MGESVANVNLVPATFGLHLQRDVIVTRLKGTQRPAGLSIANFAMADFAAVASRSGLISAFRAIARRGSGR